MPGAAASSLRTTVRRGWARPVHTPAPHRQGSPRLGSNVTRTSSAVGCRVFSTCHDGLLAPWRGAITRGPGPLVGRPETHHHTRGAVVPAGCSSRTLSASLQLCRKCNYPTLGLPLSDGWYVHVFAVSRLQGFFDQVAGSGCLGCSLEGCSSGCMWSMLSNEHTCSYPSQ